MAPYVQGTTGMMAGSSSNQKCDDDLEKCMGKTLVDGLVIVLAYAIVAYAVEGRMLDLTKVVKYYGLFVALAFIFRYVNADMNQLTRVAGVQVALKLFGVMA